MDGGGGIRTPGSRKGSAAFKAAAFNRTLPPLLGPSDYCGAGRARRKVGWRDAIRRRKRGAGPRPRLAQLGPRAGLSAGRDRPAPDPGGAGAGDDRRQRGGAPDQGRRLRPLVHRRGAHRRHDAAHRGARPGARLRPLLGPGQGRGRRRPRRAQREARPARRRLREPRRHRQADSGRLDLDRHPRDRDPLPERLRPDPRARADRRRRHDDRAQRGLRCDRLPRGAGRDRRARRALRGHAPHRSRLHDQPPRSPAAAGRGPRRARRARRRARPLRVLRLPAHRDGALPREQPHRRAAAAPGRGQHLRPRGDARELGQRRLLGDLAQRPGARSAARQGRRPPRSPTSARSTRATASSPPSGA